MTEVPTGADHGSVDATIVPLSWILEPGFRLRDAERDTEEYQQMLASVKEHGIITPITCRPVEVDGEARFELITGTQRYNCALDAGLSNMPIHVKEMDDQTAREVQIVENLRRVKQKPAQVGMMLKQMINSSDGALTVPLLARRTGSTVEYIQSRLSLNKLKPEIQALVDEESIPLRSAVMLARLPEDSQEEMLQAAMSDKVEDFLPACRSEIDRIKSESRSANDGPKTFEPNAKVRKKADLLSELAIIQGEADGTSALAASLQAAGVAVPADGCVAVLQYILCLDEASIADGREKWEAKQAQKVERTAALAAERERKKREKALQI